VRVYVLTTRVVPLARRALSTACRSHGAQEHRTGDILRHEVSHQTSSYNMDYAAYSPQCCGTDGPDSGPVATAGIRWCRKFLFKFRNNVSRDSCTDVYAKRTSSSTIFARSNHAIYPAVPPWLGVQASTRATAQVSSL